MSKKVTDFLRELGRGVQVAWASLPPEDRAVLSAGARLKVLEVLAPEPPPPSPPPLDQHAADCLTVGCRRDATVDEIRAAYRVVAQRVHPDHGGSNQGQQELNAARDRLLARAGGK